MSAHLRDLWLPSCEWPGCTRPAKKQVFNTRNAPGLVYCGTHAQKGLADFKRKVGEEVQR